MWGGPPWRASPVLPFGVSFKMERATGALLCGCFLHASLEILAGHHGRDENGCA